MNMKDLSASRCDSPPRRGGLLGWVVLALTFAVVVFGVVFFASGAMQTQVTTETRDGVEHRITTRTIDWHRFNLYWRTKLGLTRPPGAAAPTPAPAVKPPGPSGFAPRSPAPDAPVGKGSN